MKRFGSFGHPLEHSYSKKFFTEKFQREGRTDCVYENFDSDNIYDLKKIVRDNPDLVGFNVTIPYKQDVIPMLDNLDDISQRIGAVNTIRIQRFENGKFELHGFNTDAWGFELAIRPILRPHHCRALILGTGGSAKAVSYVFRKLAIEHFFVTRGIPIPLLLRRPQPEHHEGVPGRGEHDTPRHVSERQRRSEHPVRVSDP